MNEFYKNHRRPQACGSCRHENATVKLIFPYSQFLPTHQKVSEIDSLKKLQVLNKTKYLMLINIVHSLELRQFLQNTHM